MRVAFTFVLLAAGAVGTSVGAAQAEAPAADGSLYHVTTLDRLSLVDGELPDSLPVRFAWGSTTPHPYAVLDGPGEAYFASPSGFQGFDGSGIGTLALRIPGRRDVTGRLCLEGPDATLVAVRFRVPADAFSADGRREFLRTAGDEYLTLLAGGWPGAAWWRFRAGEIARELGEEAGRRTSTPGRPGRSASSNIDDTFALFTGGRAVAENLQLDRILPATPDTDEEPTVAVADVAGITVAAYDWSAATAGLSPAVDPLAARIPADQHALFFPTFAALIEVADHADAQGTPVLQALGDSTGEAGTKQRLQRQLGLPLSEIARLLGPQVIASVAITGGDPYLRSGSDVALLFEAKDADVLHPLVLARVAAAVAREPRVATTSGSIDGVDFVGHVSPGREVSAYVLRLGDAVVVSNSEAQLRRLVAVERGAPALSALPEYVFFRDRYRLGDPQESALLVVSDETIRRWCGPRWRIGASRRTRAEAALAEAQARVHAGTLAGSVTGDETLLAHPPAGVGDVTASSLGARSSTYGTLGFLTPIGELDLDRVTQAEVELYGRWRDGYQQNWTVVFDPIAVRLSVGADRLALDLTVRPLIAGSEYREFIDVARGAEIAPQACDPHDGTLLHWVMAIDERSGLLGEQTSLLRLLLPQLDPVGWLGSSVSVYLDQGPYWDELAAADDLEDFLEQHVVRMPAALHVEVGNPLLLTGFLVGARALIEQSAPGMTVWENGTHADEPFVMIRPSARATEENELPEGLAVRYAASGEGLVITLDQGVLERALDRRVARRTARKAAASGEGDPSAMSAVPDATVAPAEPVLPDWPGRHLCLAIDGKLLPVLERVASTLTGSHPLREASFSNLPILNEWRRLEPDQDPVDVHERIWKRRLLCPGGGRYVWNEAWRTMESTVYGHPGEPRPGPTLPGALAHIARAAAGLTFEDDGLRARAELVFGR